MILLNKLKILWFCMLIFLLIPGPSQAQKPSQEYQLKLAFIVNFARFITWPEEAFSPELPQLTLCILGENPFGDALNGVKGKKVGNRKLKIEQIDNLDKEPQCHLLFVSQSKVDSLAALTTAIGNRPIVTISDIPDFATAGETIEFVLKNNRLSFIINNSVLKERGVQASSSLLNLAVVTR